MARIVSDWPTSTRQGSHCARTVGGRLAAAGGGGVASEPRRRVAVPVAEPRREALAAAHRRRREDPHAAVESEPKLQPHTGTPFDAEAIVRPDAEQHPVRMLPRDARGGVDPRVELRDDRRDRTVAPGDRARRVTTLSSDGISPCSSVVNLRLDRAPKAAPTPQRNRPRGSRRPGRHGVRSRHSRRTRPRDFLAEHEIRDVVELPGADVVFASRRQLHRASERHGQWLTDGALTCS